MNYCLVIPSKINVGGQIMETFGLVLAYIFGVMIVIGTIAFIVITVKEDRKDKKEGKKLRSIFHRGEKC